MATDAFINIYNSREEALSIVTSPRILIHSCKGVQLLPFNGQPYVQVSSTLGGVNLEDVTIEVVKVCNENDTYDITNSFLIKNAFQDDNGHPQIEWHLANIDRDFGTNLVYLKMTQFSGQTYYTNAFQITENDKEKTTRIDYRDKPNTPLQSTQLQFYLWHHKKTQEISTYYEQSTKQTQVTTVKSQKYQRWVTDFMNNDLWIKITDILESKYVYLNLIRTKIFEALEVKDLEAQEDFKDNEFYVSQFSEVIDIDEIDPVIVVQTPRIELLDMSFGNGTAVYDFRTSNYPFRSLSFEWSENGNNWNAVSRGAESPQERFFGELGEIFFRVSHPEAISNVIGVDFGFPNPVIDIELIRITPRGFVQYFFFKDQIRDETFTYEYSQDQINWVGIEASSQSGTEVRFDGTGTWFFRITGSSTVSGVSELFIAPPVVRNVRFTISRPVSTKEEACTLDRASRPDARYHDGEDGIPVIGDNVYLSFPFAEQETRSAGAWYYTSYELVLYISRDNVIEQVFECPDPVNPLVKRFRSSTGKFNTASACLVKNDELPNVYYHDGAGEVPVVGDRIYNDESRDRPRVLPFAQFYYLSYGFTVRVDTDGYITLITDCSDGEIETKRFIISTPTTLSNIPRQKFLIWRNEAFHTNVNEIPSIGSEIASSIDPYLVLNGTQSNGQYLYYYTPTYNKAIQIDSNGIVIDIQDA